MTRVGPQRHEKVISLLYVYIVSFVSFQVHLVSGRSSGVTGFAGARGKSSELPLQKKL